MIGLFDSGYGGLTILKKIREELPEYSLIYLGDNKNSPYGNKSRDQVLHLTEKGVNRLFEMGCPLVILACNTSSANALREIQQKLPANKKVLGIIVPTIEKITRVRWTETHQTDFIHSVGVLATKVTVASNAYPKEIHKRNPNIKVYQEPCPNLVNMIENKTDYTENLEQHIDNLLKKDKNMEALLLGCTHYELIAEDIKKILPDNISLYTQPTIVVESLKQYLKKHHEIDALIEKNGKTNFYTTGNTREVSSRGTRFLDQKATFKNLN